MEGRTKAEAKEGKLDGKAAAAAKQRTSLNLGTSEYFLKRA